MLWRRSLYPLGCNCKRCACDSVQVSADAISPTLKHALYLGEIIRMKRQLITCLTCDVEIEHKDGLHNLEEILQLFRHHHVKGTFFLLLSLKNYPLFESSDLTSYFDQHEFGLHIHWGESNKPETSLACGLESLSVDILKREMEEGLECCKRLGFKPKSFRSGGLSQTTPALKLINRYRFHVDSSVAAKLNEKKEWLHKHMHVPYRSWYFPSKKGYDIPALRIEDRIGILEIPVTRLIPSFGSWSPYTLTPTTPLSKVIINQWLFKSCWENPLLITPIFHSWGAMGGGFTSFLKKLSGMIEYLLKKKLEPLTFSEVYDLLVLPEVCIH